MANGVLARIAMEKKIIRMICIQQCKDMLLIAAHDEFGFGAERLRRLSEAYDKAFEKFALDVVKDAKDDKQVWYSTGKCEEKLQKILGVHYVPREERYK